MSVAVKLTPADWLELDREACKRSLAEFVLQAWPVVEPAQPYVHGWHIDAIAEHLEAVTAGQINRLYICVPPGMMKSLMVSVFWPAWLWGPKGLAHSRVIATSHAEPLAIRDNLKCRRLIESEWFERMWPSVRLTTDQNEKKKFENTATGFRQAMSFTSMTGSRGDVVIIDDPLSVDDALSEVKREAVNRTFLEAVPTRLNNPESSAIVVIMQRLHERDVVGVIESKKLGYEGLVLPMEFEVDRRCTTSIGFTDPRTVEGELLFEKRFPRAVVERDKIPLGSHAVAGQFQQRPAPRDGGMFKREWFGIVDAVPANSNRVRRWDFGGTEAQHGRDPDWTVGLRMSMHAGIYYVEHVTRAQVTAAGIESMLGVTASQDSAGTRIRVPQDPGAAGKNVAASYIKLLAGYDVRATPETGSKELRARPVAAQAEAGNVKLVRGPWNDVFLDEVCMFPSGAHDDQVDALSGAFNDILTQPGAALFGTYGNE